MDGTSKFTVLGASAGGLQGRFDAFIGEPSHGFVSICVRTSALIAALIFAGRIGQTVTISASSGGN